MKTPDEIKKGLECCQPRYENDHWVTCNSNCPYQPEAPLCHKALVAGALAYIQQLEAKLAQFEREKDAAVHDMENYAGYGAICKHFDNDCPHIVEGCPLWPTDCESYEWRGVCPENTKEEK